MTPARDGEWGPGGPDTAWSPGQLGGALQGEFTMTIQRTYHTCNKYVGLHSSIFYFSCQLLRKVAYFR